MNAGVDVDFRAALHQLLGAGLDHPVEVLHRSFAVWVRLFDFADDDLRVEVPSRELIVELGGISRMSWTQYRNALAAAGLLEPGPPPGGTRPQVLRLTPPARSR